MAKTKTKTDAAATTGKPSSRKASPVSPKTESAGSKGKAKAVAPIAPMKSKPEKPTSKTKAAAASSAAPVRVPPPSKGELRAQIEKLEAANATLKAKGREMKRAAKIADIRIAELEAQLAAVQPTSEVTPAASMEQKLHRGRSATRTGESSSAGEELGEAASEADEVDG